MSRRQLSGIRFAHRMRDLPDPTASARVIAVWEGIAARTAPRPEQASPLMPPDLWNVLDRCPAMRSWKAKKLPAEPDLAGLRDRALLLVGFVAALRRSELVALTVDAIAEHANGLVLSIPPFKTNQTGEQVELVGLPRARIPARCPLTALRAWLDAAGIVESWVFRAVSTGTGRAPGP